MPRLLFVKRSLHATAGSLAVLKSGLPADHWPNQVVLLGPDPHGCADRFGSDGAAAERIGSGRVIDVPALLALRQLIERTRPELIQVWGLAAFQEVRLALIGSRTPARFIVGFDQACDQDQTLRPLVNRLLLQSAARVVAKGPGDLGRWRRLGVPDVKQVPIPPGISIPTAATAPFLHAALPDDARVILFTGPLERHAGCFEAVWAMGILKYVDDRLHLVVCGAGRETEALRRFADAIDLRHRCHFVTPNAATTSLFERSEVVWAPSLADVNEYAVLTAMAAGRPVIAARWPSLAELVVDGETGYLVRHGDKVDLARRTRQLLDTDTLRQKFGDAARQRCADRFSAAKLLERHEKLYESVLEYA